MTKVDEYRRGTNGASSSPSGLEKATVLTCCVFGGRPDLARRTWECARRVFLRCTDGWVGIPISCFFASSFDGWAHLMGNHLGKCYMETQLGISGKQSMYRLLASFYFFAMCACGCWRWMGMRAMLLHYTFHAFPKPRRERSSQSINTQASCTHPRQRSSVIIGS